MQNETKDETQEKIVTLYGKIYSIKPDTSHTCGGQTCMFYDMDCEATKFAQYCNKNDIYFIEVKNEL